MTTGGGAADYKHAYKKHFGDRPTAFALSPHASSSSAACTGFAASNTDVVASRGSVDTHTHNALQNLGWRIRSTVNQGYARSATSLDPFATSHHAQETAKVGDGGGFRSEREILANVANTRRGWSRVQTAPTTCMDFGALRAASTREVVTRTEADTGAAALAKRSRRYSSSSSSSSTSNEEEEKRFTTTTTTTTTATLQDLAAATLARDRRIAKLPTPKLSFSSSTSSTTSSSSSIFSAPLLSAATGADAHGGATRKFTRTPSSTLSPFDIQPASDPAPSGSQTEMDVDVDVDMHLDPTPYAPVQKPAGAPGELYDFSAHFTRTDF